MPECVEVFYLYKEVAIIQDSVLLLNSDCLVGTIHQSPSRGSTKLIRQSSALDTNLTEIEQYITKSMPVNSHLTEMLWP